MTATGWKKPTTVVNADRDGSDAWSNPQNADDSDESRASCDIPKQEYNDWLRAYDFDLNIPAGATIDGIEVRIERRGETNDINDDSLRLHKGGTVNGDDKASATDWPGTDTTATYGSSSDDWNTSFGVSDLNDSTFGVQLSAYNADTFAPRLAEVDCIEIQVYYTEGGGPPPGWSKTINKVTNIKSVNGIPVENIKSINGV